MDPLSERGFVQANAWQATFGLSHDIETLARLMGGNDSLATQLNYVFEMSKNARFLSSYVSYANQPGCSNAHVFSHVGKPWLTQYWVRQVAKQTYGDITPERGYGENDEDQGQMAGISALMAMGLFSLDGALPIIRCMILQALFSMRLRFDWILGIIKGTSLRLKYMITPQRIVISRKLL